MDGKIEAVVDGGSCIVGVESTILDLTAFPPRLLRPGGLPLEALEKVCGTIALDPGGYPLDAARRAAQGAWYEIPPLCAQSAGDSGIRRAGTICGLYPHASFLWGGCYLF